MNKISKFISLVLRHHPEALGLTLDEHGWADVEEMIHAIQQKQHLPFMI
jgi:putative RNA 2'-phosphotransferase